jgi:hypothetical protein
MNVSPAEYVILRMPGADLNRVNELISIAAETIGSNWGKCQDKGIALLILHWLEEESLNNGTSGGTGSAGFITKIKEGELSISKENSLSGIKNFKIEDAYLTNTTYGQELIAFKRGCFFLPRNRVI